MYVRMFIKFIFKEKTKVSTVIATHNHPNLNVHDICFLNYIEPVYVYIKSKCMYILKKRLLMLRILSTIFVLEYQERVINKT